ncbi:hypothetical protein ABIC65_004048 [Sphingomonas trueperi]|uniref:DUF1801 domain-containing protein n=1 Tax=Sphingomonas trueperi TaxID=53317 RepID=UPI0033936BC5
MDELFRFPGVRRHDPAVEAWFAQGDPLRGVLQPWRERLYACGNDVGALIHDGRPTFCGQDAAFAYVDAYAAHASIGFFFGANLPDPAGLLQGNGKRVRHVKLLPIRTPDEAALAALIRASYADIRRRLHAAN